MLAVDIYGSPAREWVGFWRSNKGGDVTWGVAADPNLVRNYRVTTLGQTVLLDRDNRVVYNGRPLGYDGLKRYMNALMSQG